MKARTSRSYRLNPIRFKNLRNANVAHAHKHRSQSASQQQCRSHSVYLIRRGRSVSPDAGGKLRPETGNPGPNRLVADLHAPPRQQILNVAQAERKPVIRPY